MTTPLLQTKLHIPRLRPEVVSRPRLIKGLNAGPPRKLTLISGPAGSGKTTLLSEWIHARGAQRHAPLRVAWLSLDGGDNDISTALLKSIQIAATLLLSCHCSLRPNWARQPTGRSESSLDGLGGF